MGAAQRNHTCIVNHFRGDHDMISRLNDLIGVVVNDREERCRFACDATVPLAHRFVAICARQIEIATTLRFGGERKAAIGRRHDERGLSLARSFKSSSINASLSRPTSPGL